MIKKVTIKGNVLQGWVQFPTGGDAAHGADESATRLGG